MPGPQYVRCVVDFYNDLTRGKDYLVLAFEPAVTNGHRAEDYVKILNDNGTTIYAPARLFTPANTVEAEPCKN
jgi:hypothetical protein